LLLRALGNHFFEGLKAITALRLFPVRTGFINLTDSPFSCLVGLEEIFDITVTERITQTNIHTAIPNGYKNHLSANANHYQLESHE
jgi:hypothetical protein